VHCFGVLVDVLYQQIVMFHCAYLARQVAVLFAIVHVIMTFISLCNFTWLSRWLFGAALLACLIHLETYVL